MQNVPSAFSESCITTPSPKLTLTFYFFPKYKLNSYQQPFELAHLNHHLKPPFNWFHFQILSHWRTSLELGHMLMNGLLRLIRVTFLEWFVQLINDRAYLVAFVGLILFSDALSFNCWQNLFNKIAFFSNVRSNVTSPLKLDFFKLAFQIFSLFFSIIFNNMNTSFRS